MFVNSNVPCMRVYTCVRMYVYVLLQTLDIFCIRLKIIEHHYICKERNLIIFSGTSTIDKIHDNCIAFVLLIYLSIFIHIFVHFCISIFTYNTYIFCKNYSRLYAMLLLSLASRLYDIRDCGILIEHRMSFLIEKSSHEEIIACRI